MVLGGTTSEDRFGSTVKMFDYGFANYKNKIVLDSEITLNDEFALSGGKKTTFAVRPERNCYVFSKADSTPDITYNITSYPVKAPVACDDIVGKIEVFKDGILVDSVNIVAAENVGKANFGDYFIRSAENWAI